MSEEPTKPEDQAAAEQFDAEAAQAAKDFLEEGVTRSEDKHMHGIYNKNGHILDQNGETISSRAQGEFSGARISQEFLDKRPDNPHPVGSEAAYEYDQIEFQNEDNRDASLWRGRQHYLDNQAGYVAQAVEDANAEGHDITIGGHHFPATNAEQQPPQPEQSNGSEGVGATKWVDGMEGSFVEVDEAGNEVDMRFPDEHEG